MKLALDKKLRAALSMSKLTALILLLLSAATSAQNTVTITPTAPTRDETPDVYRGTTRIEQNAASLQACINRIRADAATRPPGKHSYSCRYSQTGVVATVPCPPKPADETRTQQCPSGTTGSWTQTSTYTSTAAPTCWTASAWVPTIAPSGACTTTPPPATGTATLTWVAPTDPAVTGYRVYYGTAARTYLQAPGSGLQTTMTTYIVSGLAAGRTYYFTVTSTAADGRESDYSNEGIKVFP